MSETESEARSGFRGSAGESAKPEWALLGRRLSSIRGSKTQPEMAKALGVSKTTYGRWERGVREVGSDALQAYAAWGWNPLWILTGQGEKRLRDVGQGERDNATIITGKPDDPEVQDAYKRRNKAISDWSAGLQQGMSQSARLDPDMITEAVKLLTWAFDLQGARYDPAQDPDLLAETYAFLVEHGGSMTPDNLVDFSKRLAERRAKEDANAKEQGGRGSKEAG